jgi:glutathione S-transferase
MIELHYFPGNASMVPHIVLHELGLPFEKLLVDRDAYAHKSPAYLALNPNGLIPVLVDDGLVLYETAAICLHLADRHPAAGLSPPLGSADRAELYKWLIWMTNTLQATLIHYFYPERMVDAGNSEGAMQVRAHAQARVGTLVDQIEAQLERQHGPWLLGERYSLADAYGFVMCRWTRGFSGSAAAPARERPAIAAWLQRVLARPAVQRVFADEGLQPPWY